MSKAELDQLLADRSLVREEFTDELIASIWAKAAASYTDAAVGGLTSEGAFQLLYTAALQAAVATLAAHGLRVKSTANHYETFYALRKLDPAVEPAGAMFDEMRGTRNESIYEATHDEAELADALSEARATCPRRWRRSVRPSSPFARASSPGYHASRSTGPSRESTNGAVRALRTAPFDLLLPH